MAIAATPSTLDVIPESAYVLPGATVDPLGRDMLNAHHAYRYFRPPLWDGIYTVEPLAARAYSIKIPLPAPSADVIPYSFVHRIRTGPGVGTLGVSVDYWDGAVWTGIEAAAGIAGPASSVVEYVHVDPLSASARILRCVYTRAGGLTLTPDSLIVVPWPGAVTSGIKPSKFWPYDTGLLTAPNAPITTELRDRPWRDAMAIARDRRQCVLSWAQEDDSVPSSVLYNATGTAATDDEWQILGYARASLPYQTTLSATVSVLCGVGGGSTLARVRVDQIGGSSVTFDADDLSLGTVAVKSEPLTLALDGTLGATAELRVSVRRASGRATYLHGVTADWRRGD